MAAALGIHFGLLELQAFQKWFINLWLDPKHHEQKCVTAELKWVLSLKTAFLLAITLSKCQGIVWSASKISLHVVVTR